MGCVAGSPHHAPPTRDVRRRNTSEQRPALQGKEFGVVVIGGGLAGSVAALRAQELGCAALLVDRAPTAGDESNTALSGGILHAAMSDPRSPSDVILPRVIRETCGKARIDVLTAFAERCAGSIGWLEQHGVRFEVESTQPPSRVVFSPVRSLDRLSGWRGVGAHAALATLRERFVAAGGTVASGVRAREISWGPSTGVTGVVAERGIRFDLASRSVVLADGGFHANKQMLKQYVGQAADRIAIRGSHSSEGDGIRMAEAVGAKLVNMRFFYGHCLHRDATSNHRLWPMPILDDLVSAGTVVSANGARLLKAGQNPIAIANELARVSDPRAAWVIVDDKTWLRSCDRSLGWPTPHPDIEKRGGLVHHAADVDQLAGLCGMEPETLADALLGDRCKVSTTRNAFGAERDRILRAIPIVPGITFTMGGPLIDGSARVLDEEERPINGLFAAGSAAGGLQGAAVTGGYVGGLAPAAVFGLVAGEAAAYRSTEPVRAP